MTTATTTGLIVDDEPLARARLRQLLREAPWLQSVGEAGSGRAAIAAIDEIQPDLVFLDVQLPDVSGLEVLRRIRHVPTVIFTTAFDQFAIAAFEIGAIDYLLKPFGRDRFSRAIERARPWLEQHAGVTGAERAREVLAAGPVRRLFVRDGGRIVPVPAGAIERLQACDDFVLVHAGGKVYRVNMQLTDLERRLDPRAFVRIHRSHIVNLDHVTALAPYDGSRIQVVVRSGASIVASRQRSRTLREVAR